MAPFYAQIAATQKYANPQPSTRKPKTENRNPKPETRDPKSETRDPKPETRNLKPETRNPRPETRNPKPYTPYLCMLRVEGFGGFGVHPETAADPPPRSKPDHSRILEGPIYMWGCKTLYQDKVIQPRSRPNQGSSGSKGNGSYDCCRSTPQK
ncbi:hypothetical protein T484DRAFT_1613242 [Baffinella frigidus]|nr:hypothetical protein T484DRAFT_1613242 [Cryptophyta sp. CCMP2293]